MATQTLPMYRQLAGELRFQIGTAGLKAGDALPSYRDGAERWGVNLHTVRRAYQVLEAEGLLCIAPGRCATVSPSPAPSVDGSLDHYLRRVVADAARFHGLDGPSLVRNLERLVHASAPVLHVAECSMSLVNNIARELQAALRVTCSPLLIGDLSSVPAGAVLVSTHFHRKELRSVARRAEIELVPVFPRPDFVVAMRDELRRRSGGVVLLETDPVFAQNIRASLEDGLGCEVRVAITENPRRFLGRIDSSHLAIVSPRNWDRLTRTERTRANVRQLLYTIPRDAIVRLAMTRGFELSATL